ncbi:uncharacterized protein LOC108208136 [Daucus carota subsp. sativus]|uniref:uncharacterized protein LOC108208136 n=1 Tax=Daucus carota subsp. sativus TaxID=79200 RepID=UPI0007F01174|nr:PREDICTED: uncharacterized protein LOC108208136 [Daucus carota subsp. sativus]
MVFYDGWKLSACILLSLFLQIFLVVAGSFRRLASRRWIVKIIWFAYLLAEFVAVFGLGLIVSRQSLLYNDYKDDIVQVRCMVHGVSDSCKDDHILMYWATFLLVHLGGPDTITAFATEDNELWLRNLFYLSSKCIAVAYAIYQSVETNYRVEVPILLLFLYGIIKCTERTCALYYGSAKSFRNSMLSKSNLGVNDFSKKEDTLLIKMNGEALFNIEVLQCASVFFMTFKGLVVDLSVGIHDLNQSRDFFLQRSSQDAFRLVEVELNYLYDVLFTKIPVLHSKLGLCGRTLSFMAVVSSLVVFYCDFGVKVVNYKIDLVLTYILYFGAIVLEVIAFYMLLFCDWTVVKLRLLSDANPNHKSWKDKFLDCILSVNNTRSAFYNSFLRLIGDRNHQRPNLLIEDFCM